MQNLISVSACTRCSNVFLVLRQVKSKVTKPAHVHAIMTDCELARKNKVSVVLQGVFGRVYY